MARLLVRSYLYVPADSADRLSRAGSRRADAVIADLEDSVASSRKELARENTTTWLSRSTSGPRPERWVRVNAGAEGLEDIAAVFAPGLTGVCLPKVSGRAELERASDVLDRLERRAGIPAQGAALMPLVETAVGLQSLSDMARAPRVRRLQLGELDLQADLGLQPGDDEAELAPLRSAVVVASAAAGLQPPVGPVSPDFRDLVALEASTVRLRRAGFVGRAAIHPAQISVIHKAFTPSREEVARASALVGRYEAALAAGSGVLVDENGRMVDEAVVRRCRRTIALAATDVDEEDPSGN